MAPGLRGACLLRSGMGFAQVLKPGWVNRPTCIISTGWTNSPVMQQKQHFFSLAGGRIFPSVGSQKPAWWPISGVNSCVLNFTRTYHEPPLATERQGLGDGGRSQVRGSPPFKPRSIYYDKPAETERQGLRDGGSSQARGSPPFKPRANYYEKLGETRGEGEGRSSQASGRPAFKPRENYNDKPAATDRQGLRDGGSSQARGSPPFKPKANYYEKLAEFRGVGEGEGRSTQASGRLAFKPRANHYDKPVASERQGLGNGGSSSFKPRANYYEKLAESRGEGEGRSSEASGRPAFKPRANYYDKPAQYRGAEGDSGGSTERERPPFKPKANYYDNRGVGSDPEPAFKPAFKDIRPRTENKTAPYRGAEGDSGGSTERERLPFTPKANYYDNREVGSNPKPAFKDRRPRSENSENGPHFGYKFRVGGPELGEFRRIGPQDGDSAATDIQRKIAQFRESRDGRGPVASDDSDDIRNESLNVSEKVPEEGVDRKYSPRRLVGEKKWQFAVRKKQLGLAGHTRGSTRKTVHQFVDDEGLGDEPLGDEWRRKKTIWLCKEIPPLRPRPIVTILNEQRSWIHAEDIKYIIEHLLRIDQTLRAHRVLKWEMQQPWYAFDYELSTKVAVQLGQVNKLSRTRDIYDLIIKNGRVPTLSTYEVLINCYIADAENTALAQAWSLFNQLSQLGGHEPSPTLSYNMFQGLAQKGLAFLDQADELFRRIKASGLVCSTEMYSLLIHSHGTKGNQDRVNELIIEMKETGLPVGQDVYSAILKSCAKGGNVAVGEQAFTDLKLTGHKLNPSIYSSLIKMYGKAGLHEKAFQTFEDMRQMGTSPNLTVYEPMIEVAVMCGDRDQAEKLLEEAQERKTPSLHGCYNALMALYSKSGLLDDLDRLFNEMEGKGYPPNQASYNVLLEAYATHHLLEKADAVYETMKRGRKAKPSWRTYELMIRIYGEAKKHEKLKEVFKELENKKMDVPEDAKKYLVTAVSPKQLEAHRKSKLKLSREQREILAGVLLAGAGVQSHDKNRTYECHFGLHPDSEVGLPLMNHLYDLFSDWSTGPLERNSKMQLAFQTVSHGSLRFFAHQYRPAHKPVIPRLVHRWLTPRALAYWYMYGGSKCPQTGDILLNAAPYTDKEIMLVVNALKSRTIDCEKQGSGRRMAVCFNGRSAVWLWGLMEPHILPELKGLLNPEADQGGEDLMQQV